MLNICPFSKWKRQARIYFLPASEIIIQQQVREKRRGPIPKNPKTKTLDEDGKI
ncbi:hypothetical protein LINPERPRIM_LOCUS15461, partial [Linum perenne]